MARQFICGYMGCTYYKIDGVEYRQRHLASEYERSVCNAGVFEAEVKPCVGTIMGEVGEFPSDEVMQEFPGYVPARWNSDTSRVETKGHPTVITGTNGNVLVAKAYEVYLEELSA